VSKCDSINIEVLIWARERAGFSQEDIAVSLPRIVEWEAGRDYPTYSQLDTLSQKYKRPLAMFFFSRIPEEEVIESSFRSDSANQVEFLNPKIHYLLKKAKFFQSSLSELQESKTNFDSNNSMAALKESISIDKMVEFAREYLKVSLEDQKSWRSSEKAFEKWRKVFVDIGVYTFKDAFNDDSFSGFCIYDEKYPVIYINNSTTSTRQIFTLFHEIAHIFFKLNHIDAINDEYERVSSDASNIEILCNKFAAEFLVPSNDLLVQLRGVNRFDESLIDKLSKIYSVSREVIVRKIYGLKLIDKTMFDLIVGRLQASNRSSSGGMYYNTQLAYLGKQYVGLVLKHYHQNRITASVASQYLDIKPKNFEKFEQVSMSVAL
jgi:Zn-dependent peptidase ImmA (M78 family)